MNDVTSPYIFPFRAFRHLDVAEANAQFAPARAMTETEIAPWLGRFAPALQAPHGRTISERILALLLLPQVVFGDPDFIISRRDDWIAALDRLVLSSEPVEFTILGYPFKMPVPLKTNRRFADFGEAVSLKRLNEIGAAIAAIHDPGARIHVFTEGPFGELNGIARDWADGYFASLETLVQRFGIGEHIKLHDLNRVADDFRGFRQTWRDTTEDIRRRRDAGDAKTLEAIRDALPVRFHNIANPGISDDDLRRAYNSDPSAAALRADIQRRAESGVLGYRGFLEARDRVQLLEAYAPGALAMTVSPRPGRLGVRPLPAPSDLLPYHGVPVINAEGTVLRIEYLWDLTHGGGKFEPIMLTDDLEATPFLYREA